MQTDTCKNTLTSIFVHVLGVFVLSVLGPLVVLVVLSVAMIHNCSLMYLFVLGCV